MTRAMSSLALLTVPLTTLAVLSGCPDPNPTGQFSAPAPSAAGSASSGSAPAGDGSTAPNSARFNVADGESVKLSGTVAYEGTATGRMQLDFLQVPDGSPPRLVNSQQLQGAGQWSAKVPKDFGDIYIVAFIDKDGDGPSVGDPAGRTDKAVVVGAEDIADIVIQMTDDPELGTLKPGGTGALPGGGVPTPDGPAPDGAAPEPTGDASPGEPAPEGAPGGPPVDGDAAPEGDAAPAGGPEGAEPAQ